MSRFNISPTWRWLRNRRFPEGAVRNDDGWTGTRHALVMHQPDPIAALDMPGLPRYGDAWSSARPDLTIRNIDSRLADSENDTIIRFDYRTPRAGSGGDTPPVAGAKVTTLGRDVGSETIQFSLPDDEGMTHDLGENGVAVPTVAIGPRVSIWYEPGGLPNLNAIIALHTPPKVNADAGSLPNFMGTGFSVPVAARELLYLGWEAGLDAGLIRIDHTFAWGPTHDVVVKRRNADGTLKEVSEPLPVFEDGDFSVLGL